MTILQFFSVSLSVCIIWSIHYVRSCNRVYNYFNFLDSENNCDRCQEVLDELETIDDDTDNHGILFVKSNDEKLAHEIGIFSFPSLVYYETGVPIMYDGKAHFFYFISVSSFLKTRDFQSSKT